MSSAGSIQTASLAATNATNADQTQIKTKEVSVRIPKNKGKYHALKFHSTSADFSSWVKTEMYRDTSTLPTGQKQEWESMPKSGQGSEFGREAKEMAKRRRFMYNPKKTSIEDMPWIISAKCGEKEKGRERHFIGKKSVSENSSYFVFVKLPDGSFEAHPLEDWYSFAPHRTYKTLNIEEAEEEFKRRHKILNKCLIMANKRKNEELEFDDDEEEDNKKGFNKALYGGSTAKSSKAAFSDDDEEKKPKKRAYNKSSNLSDEDEDAKSDEDEFRKKPKSKVGGKKKTRKDEYNSDDEFKTKEDSDDGDHEGLEKDYSSSGTESESEPETSKYEEKYQEKGIDEEEPLKALEKSEDEDSEEEGLTEEGKEYRKLMSKNEEEENESDEIEDIFKNEDSKDSSSTVDDLDLDEATDKSKKAKSSGLEISKKLKRKATDNLAKTKESKKQNKATVGSGPISTTLGQDDSSSSSSTSNINQSKSAKTAAILAAVQQQTSASPSSNANSSASLASKSSNGITEEEVRRYLTRKPMTTTELFHKFRSKTQNTMTKEDIFQALKVILDRLKCKIIEQNGVNYLSLQ